MRQSEQWQSFFRNIVLQAVYCSDLKRAVQTARLIAQPNALMIESLPGLREIDLGAWEGELFEKIRVSDRAAFELRGRDPCRHRPPSGESFEDLCARVVPVFEQIAGRSEGNTLIAGHAGVNRVILCRLLGMPLSNLFRIGQDYAALNIIVRQGAHYRVQAFNLPLNNC